MNGAKKKPFVYDVKAFTMTCPDCGNVTPVDEFAVFHVVRRFLTHYFCSKCFYCVKHGPPKKNRGRRKAEVLT